MSAPKFDEMMPHLIQALRNLGGSAHIRELENEVSELMKLSEEDLNEAHTDSMTKFVYNLAWTRTHLRIYELIENSSRGIWSLTSKGQETINVDIKKIKRHNQKFKKTNNIKIELSTAVVPEFDYGVGHWQTELLEYLKTISPDAFERLSQRLLRESGFTHVEVTGKTGDGGIDGKGMLQIGLITFNVVFQSKRYKGAVPVSVIRDFRGAMMGRAEKGIVITTGRFGRGAIEEAQREGAPIIDLIDGEALVNKMKDLNMGVKVETVEKVSVKKEWFSNL